MWKSKCGKCRVSGDKWKDSMIIHKQTQVIHNVFKKNGEGLWEV